MPYEHSFDVIGMVSIILVLMVISTGFGIIKLGSIGDQIKGIAEEDLVDPIESVFSYDRAPRVHRIQLRKQPLNCCSAGVYPGTRWNSVSIG